MSKVKELRVSVISARIANRFVKKHHYSGKVTPNSQLHFGVYLNGVLHGAMSFGPGIDKRKMMRLIKGTQWNEFLELNRLAFDDILPRNSESRALAIVMRLIRRNAPQIKWVVSFADATQCGDGTIYRASGFVLTSIKKNSQMLRLSDGSIVAGKSLDNPNHQAPNGAYGRGDALKNGAEYLPGYQLRYIYFLDPDERKNLTCEEIPFAEIAKRGAAMYKGVRLASVV